MWPPWHANSGTKYSTRAANLVSCVVEQQPEFAFALHNELLSANVMPGQNQPNWHTDEQLIEIAETVGVDPNTELKQCMKDQRFAGFISGNWKAASETGLLGLADGAVLYANPSTGELQNPDGPQRLVSTPTVIINGQQWNSATDGDLETYILKLIAENGGADEAAESAEDEAATE